MASEDDFIIAIDLPFKKSTQQKFSLLTLVLVSIFVILLSSFDFRVVRIIKIGINEFVYDLLSLSQFQKIYKNTFRYH